VTFGLFDSDAFQPEVLVFQLVEIVDLKLE